MKRRRAQPHTIYKKRKLTILHYQSNSPFGSAPGARLSSYTETMSKSFYGVRSKLASYPYDARLKRAAAGYERRPFLNEKNPQKLATTLTETLKRPVVKKRLRGSGSSGCSRDSRNNTPVHRSRSLRVAIKDGDVQATEKPSGGRHFELEHKDEHPEDDGCCSGFELELEDNYELRENGLGDNELGENGLGDIELGKNGLGINELGENGLGDDVLREDGLGKEDKQLVDEPVEDDDDRPLDEHLEGDESTDENDEENPNLCKRRRQYYPEIGRTLASIRKVMETLCEKVESNKKALEELQKSHSRLVAKWAL